MVHILGTAHISADSAQVAGQLVRETRPKGVFVELDAKRVGRAFSNDSGGESERGSVGTGYVAAGGESVGPPPTQRGSDEVTVTRSERGVVAEKKGWGFNPFNVVQNAGKALVGGALRDMYKNLESQGFSAGEEFVIAVKEGLTIGSTIILGDRDVDVTLDHLTTAFRKTDLKKLLANDSDFERNVEGLMPDDLRRSLNDPATAGDMTDAQQLSVFVETLKAKDTVKKMMGEVKKAAPELYTALVAERDEYMANGIDTLNQYESMVAVMGMAHVDGVENNLMVRGWRPVSTRCPIGS